MTQPRHIVLVGLIGSGKTTLGAQLAARLRLPFVDSDGSLAKRWGRTARQIARADGLDQLHAYESRVLADALASSEQSVIAAAASTIEDPASRQALAAQDILVIWLRGSPVVLARRAGRGTHRPFAAADNLAVLTEQTARRGPLFAAVADAIADVDERAPADVLEAALAVVGRDEARP